MTLKIHLSQINTSVGDLELNCAKILSELKVAQEANCDLVVFCEMTVSGYPAQDLWEKRFFIDEIEDKIIDIMDATKGSKCAILLGAPTVSMNRSKKEVVNNSAILIEDGKVMHVHHKKSLANYGVFDEKRYFEPGVALSFVEFRGLTLAILVCEDLWDMKNLFLLGEQVMDVVISINSSPYSVKKQEARENVAGKAAKTLNKPVVYVNQVGGQDSLVFDGSSFVMGKDGNVMLRMNSFQEDSATIQLAKDGTIISLVEGGIVTKGELLENNYKACMLGLRDYVHKSGFKKVLLGMSGGIDSALVATIAVDALGSDNVFLYALPSRYNSDSSMVDAKQCAQNLGVNLEVISIESIFNEMVKTLKNSQGEIAAIVEENLQSRIRGNLLMALSNDSGALLLSTGNKSELACGYATLYGDMCGAFNPIKDLYKTQVYEVAKWRNGHGEILKQVQDDSPSHRHPELVSGSPIPDNILTKAPSAELRPDQKDSDSLPEYEILDKILLSLIEEQKSIADIVALGFDEGLVNRIAKLFYSSEYKRQQSCIGPKISKMSFDRERRYPLTKNYLK